MINLLNVRQAWETFKRDRRSGELRLLFLALIIAIVAVSSVGFLSDRVSRALERDTGQMLAADLLLESDGPVQPALISRAQNDGLEIAQTWQFPSMVAAGDQTQLASVKAVSDTYPLRGALKLKSGFNETEETVRAAPEPGTVWVEPQLLIQMRAGVGDSIQLGNQVFRVAKIIDSEPDKGLQFVNIAPRLMLNATDLEATGLIAPGSRVKYALLLAGESKQVAAYRLWLETAISKGQQIRGTESVQPEIRQSLDRAQQFFALVALLTVLIACVAIALGASRFTKRHQDGVAVMRTLGATSGQVRQVLLFEFLLIAVFAAVIGSVAGFLFHYFLLYFLTPLLQTELPAPTLLPAFQAALVGIVLLLGFAVPPLLQLSRVSPLKVIRQDLQLLATGKAAAYVLGGVVFFALLWWFARDFILALIVGAGFLGALAAFALFSWFLVLLVAMLRNRLSNKPVLRFALAGMVSRKKMTITQVCSLALGLMIILLLGLIRTDLLSGWRNTLPDNAPNRFLINIQADQRAAVQDFFTRNEMGMPELEPMVRGRLVRVNDREIGPDDYSEQRTRRLVQREFNLSYLEQLPENNTVIEGRWLDHTLPEVSFEDGLAADLGLKLHDTVTFDVAGQLVKAKISSLRTVKWDSMQVNFFAIMSAPLLQNQPTTWITSFYLPEGKPLFTQELVNQFPNITVFNVSGILAQLESVLSQVSLAVQLLFLFTFLAGVIVLIAAFLSTYDERIYEAAVLRSLGATSRQLDQAQRLELFIVGLFAGLLAASAATLVAGLLAHYIFDFIISLSYWPWLAGVLIGVTASSLGGKMALKGVKTTPPLQVLRSVD
ncbi:MAG: FtsX-like permease family protein [Alcaligenaceae bacterium]|nr:FtsX-like permease family protein [Alcaligenaceae bacterium]